MNSSRLFPNITLFSTPQARWSEPELSIDSYRGIKKGKLHCWDATGPARDAFEQIRQQVIDRLNGARIQVPSSSMIMVDIFMIGKDQARARPYIMFSCRHRESRKAAVAAIKESDILDQCPPGMLLGDWDYPPHLINVRPLASSGVKSNIVINAVEVHEEVTKSYRCRVYPVLDLKSGKIRALRLATQNDSTNYGSPCMATIGSVIKLRGKKYYLVPAHVFNATTPDVRSGEMSLSEDSECDIGEFDSDDESFSGGQDEADFMSRHSASAESSDIEEDWDLDSSNTMSDGESTQAFDERREQPPSIVVANDKAGPSADEMKLFSVNHHAFSLARPPRLRSDSFDYCLMEIDDESISTDLPVLSKDTIGQLDGRSVNVTAITGSGNILRGILSGRKSCIRLPYATNFVEVLTTQFEDSLQPGVCGSIVRDANTGEIYGHLVAGDTESQFAFIVQAADVLDDAMTRLSEPGTVSTYDKQIPPPPSVLHEPFVESMTQYNDAYWFGHSSSIFHAGEMSSSDTSLDGGSVGDSSSLDISLDGLSLADDACEPSLGNTWHVSSSHSIRNRSLQERASDSSAAAGVKKRRIDLEGARNDPCAQPEDFGGSRQAITGLKHPGSHIGLDIEDAFHALGGLFFTSCIIPQTLLCWELHPIQQNYEMIENSKCGMIYGRENYQPLLEEFRHISDALTYLHEQLQRTFTSLQGEHDFLSQNIMTPLLSPTSTEWIPLTTFGYDDGMLADNGRHKESQAHDIDDSHTYMSYTWDKMKLFKCHLCSRDKANGNIFTGVLTRHIMDKHRLQYVYEYAHGCVPCHCRDKIVDHFRSHSASNRHEYGYCCHCHCSAKTLRSRLGPDIVTELLGLQSRFLSDADGISNSPINSLPSGRLTTIIYCAPSWLPSSLNGLRLWGSHANLGKNRKLHEISIAPLQDPSQIAFASLKRKVQSPFPFIAFVHGIDCEIRLDPDQETTSGGILVPRIVDESTKESKVPISRNGGFVQVIHRNGLNLFKVSIVRYHR
ncbi:hypothetical protein N7481_000248 [Penicillium waksmanii]|uniref:uncharacterized protein n=1 Tax=Penicillium waksmanii TaxID=69791 RepID=UPI0025473098|nr:uncharacterized protein N7481_000248 [Penicillium waksmanii]KAJ5999839.1 hypothetical protein N7481_000248 [Penicillium waksmanii]